MENVILVASPTTRGGAGSDFGLKVQATFVLLILGKVSLWGENLAWIYLLVDPDRM